MPITFPIWWATIPEKINPIALDLKFIQIHYYGLMYIVAFAVTYFLVDHRSQTEPEFADHREHIMDIMTYMIFGVLIGGRFGYVLFYNFSWFLHHPLEIFLPFDIADGFRFTGLQGMSFHGGLIGVLLFSWISVRNLQLGFWKTADLFVPAFPLGYTFGRLGNFINGELFGRATDLPWGMIFPMAPDSFPRHPSQLYEAGFEGIFLFAVLWRFRKMKLPPGAMLAFYLVGYGIVRFLLEFAREPDAHLGFGAFGLTRGQTLCMLMILGGVILCGCLFRRRYRPRT